MMTEVRFAIQIRKVWVRKDSCECNRPKSCELRMMLMRIRKLSEVLRTSEAGQLRDLNIYSVYFVEYLVRCLSCSTSLYDGQSMIKRG